MVTMGTRLEDAVREGIIILEKGESSAKRSMVTATIRRRNPRQGWCPVTSLQLLSLLLMLLGYLYPTNTCSTLNILSSHHSTSNFLCQRVNHQRPSMPLLSKYNNSLLLNSNSRNNRAPGPGLIFHRYQCGMPICSQPYLLKDIASPDQASLHLRHCLPGSDRISNVNSIRALKATMLKGAML
jgi:hypothetical protein